MLMLVIDMLMELLFNTANSLSGYMLGSKVLGWPEPAAFLLAATFGVAGMANHWRALRKSAPAVPVLLLAIVFAGCSTLPVLPGTEKAQMDLAKFAADDVDAAIAAATIATDAGAPYRLRCWTTLKKYVGAAPVAQAPTLKGLVSAYEFAAEADAKIRSGLSLVPVDVKADCAYVEAELLRFAARTGAKFAPIPGAAAIGGIIQ